MPISTRRTDEGLKTSPIFMFKMSRSSSLFMECSPSIFIFCITVSDASMEEDDNKQISSVVAQKSSSAEEQYFYLLRACCSLPQKVCNFLGTPVALLHYSLLLCSHLNSNLNLMSPPTLPFSSRTPTSETFLSRIYSSLSTCSSVGPTADV